LRRFGEYVRQAESKHALVIFDACFAGTIFETQRSMPPAAVTRATTLPVRQFISSGDAEQTVSDDGRFRELFLRALRGEERADSNNDGYLTGSELGMHLYDRVTNLSNGVQTPRFGKLLDKDWDRGDFVFILPGVHRLPPDDSHRIPDQREILPLSPGSTAIFPSTYKSTQGLGVQKIMEAVVESLIRVRPQIIQESMYAYTRELEYGGVSTLKIPVKYINRDVERKLWTKKTMFSSSKPDVDLISEIGGNLGVSIVLMYNIVDQAGADITEIWLIDVKRKKIIHLKETANFNARYTELVDLLADVTTRAFISMKTPGD
jgi:hypothetical protein